MHIVAECTCPINEQATKQKTYCSTGKKMFPTKITDYYKHSNTFLTNNSQKVVTTLSITFWQCKIVTMTIPLYLKKKD